MMSSKVLRKKLIKWEETGTHNLNQEEIEEAIIQYKALIEASYSLPHMEIIRKHAVMEVHRLEGIVGRDKR